MSHFKPRDYQISISDEAVKILKAYNIVVLNVEVRCGKTFMSLMTAQKLNVKNVLFVTKKKAISSIQDDYNTLNPNYDITIINYESLHKLPKTIFDLVVVDESHSISSFPKPSKRAKDLKSIVKDKYLILMSGTLTPESYSQIYHQFWISKHTPFKQYSNFYKWAKDYCVPKTKRIGSFTVNDYSEANYDKIKQITDKYLITYTQQQAGFESSINETILRIDAPTQIHTLCKRLKNDLVVEGKNEVILADTAVKLMQKTHQLYSGTVKFESGNSMVIDPFKAEYIYKRFGAYKIGIFYKFKEELNAIKQIYKDEVCTDLETFNNTDKSIALQIVSGREGVSLRKAKYLVYYNIDFSATSYWQSRDRMTTKERNNNQVYWIFTKGGIEDKIYKAVSNKKNYTLRHFKNDRTANPKKENRPT